MMSDHASNSENSRIQIVEQLAQVKRGVVVLVPRLSKEEINAHTRRSRNSKRKIGTNLRGLDSGNDCEEMSKRNSIPCPAVKIESNNTAVQIRTKSSDNLEDEQSFTPRIVQNKYPGKTIIYIGNEFTSSDSHVHKSLENMNIPSTSTATSISKMSIQSTSSTAQKSVSTRPGRPPKKDIKKNVTNKNNPSIDTTSDSLTSIPGPSISAPSTDVVKMEKSSKNATTKNIKKNTERGTISVTPVFYTAMNSEGTSDCVSFTSHTELRRQMDPVCSKPKSPAEISKDGIKSETKVTEKSTELTDIPLVKTCATPVILETTKVECSNCSTLVKNTQDDSNLFKENHASSRKKSIETHSIQPPAVSEPSNITNIKLDSTESVLLEKVNPLKSSLKSSKPGNLLMHYLALNTSEVNPSPSTPISSISKISSALSNLERSSVSVTKVPIAMQETCSVTSQITNSLTIGDAIDKTIISTLLPKKSTNQRPLSIPSVDKNEVIKPKFEPAIQPPPKLRVKSGTMLGIIDTNLKDFLITTRVEDPTVTTVALTLGNPDTSNTNTVKTTLIQSPMTTKVVNSVVSKMISQEQHLHQLYEYIYQIAINMKEQFIFCQNIDSRKKSISEQMQKRPYIELQSLEMQNLIQNYEESTNARYRQIVVSLKFCINCMNLKDILRQIFLNFEFIMNYVKKPNLFSVFVEILTHALWPDNFSSFELLTEITKSQFKEILNELRVEFHKPMSRCSKNLAHTHKIRSQIRQTCAIPQPQCMPVFNKKSRAETTPYLLNSTERQNSTVNMNIADYSCTSNSSMISKFLTNIRNIPMISNPPNFEHLTQSSTYYNPNVENMNVVCNQHPTVPTTNAMGELMASMFTDSLHNHDSSESSIRNSIDDIRHQAENHISARKNRRVEMNPDSYRNPNQRFARFHSSPPPYPQHFVRPEMSQDLTYQMVTAKAREFVHQRVVTQSTIVQPNILNRRSSAEVHRSKSPPYESLNIHPAIAAQISEPVCQNHLLHPAIPARHRNASTFIHSTQITSDNPTVTSQLYPNRYSRLTATNTYRTLRNRLHYQNQQSRSRALNQGYLSMTEPVMNFINDVGAPATPSNSVPKTAQRSLHVSAQRDNARNEFGQNNLLSPTQRSSFSINDPSLPSFTLNCGNKPLEFHTVNSSQSPSTRNFSTLTSSYKMPISVPIVQSSSSPNVDQCFDFEGLESLSETFLKDSEFEEEYMESNDLHNA